MNKLILIIVLTCLAGIMQAQVTHVRVSCYHPVKKECDSDPLTTSDGSKINLKHLKQKKIRWCAISRDLLWMFPKDKPKRVLIEGYGVYEVKDTMNARFNHCIDILKHPSDKDTFCVQNVKVTILK